MDLNSKQKQILLDIFDNFDIELKGTDKESFRANHDKSIKTINQLVSDNFILWETDNNTYRLPLSVLTFFKRQTHIKSMLTDMETLFKLFRKHRVDYIDDTLRLTDVQKQTKLSRERVIECHAYFSSILTIVGNNLLTDEGSFYITDYILEFTSFKEILDLAVQRDFPKEENNKGKNDSHGNTINNALKHEQILGAAIYVMARHPEDGKQGEKFVGRRIAKKIDELAPNWWPETGKPPLETSTMEKLINKYLKIKN